MYKETLKLSFQSLMQIEFYFKVSTFSIIKQTKQNKTIQL